MFKPDWVHPPAAKKRASTYWMFLGMYMRMEPKRARPMIQKSVQEKDQLEFQWRRRWKQHTVNGDEGEVRLLPEEGRLGGFDGFPCCIEGL